MLQLGLRLEVAPAGHLAVRFPGVNQPAVAVLSDDRPRILRPARSAGLAARPSAAGARPEAVAFVLAAVQASTRQRWGLAAGPWDSRPCVAKLHPQKSRTAVVYSCAAHLRSCAARVQAAPLQACLVKQAVRSVARALKKYCVMQALSCFAYCYAAATEFVALLWLRNEPQRPPDCAPSIQSGDRLSRWDLRQL